MRVLDLGCGDGQDLVRWGVTASDEVTGVDIDNSSLVLAKSRFGTRKYVQAKGEDLPFKNESFDRVISGVALPYMNIPRALGEIHRVLVPGGHVTLSLHVASVTIWELRHHAIPKPIPTLFRLYVLADGIFFHATGKTVGFPGGRTESFQTERGIRIALACAKFASCAFQRGTGPVLETFFVEARKADNRCA
jgi:ubiquinone/menaquinone biosynthesis C-methylase UbiE